MRRMRTLLLVSLLAVSTSAFAAASEEPNLAIRDVDYDEATGAITIEVCGSGARVTASYSFIMEVDFKKDNYGFPAASAGADGCVITSWSNPLSSLSGQGGVPAGRYDLSVTLNNA